MNQTENGAGMIQLDQLFVGSLSANKAERQHGKSLPIKSSIATHQLEILRVDQPTTSLFLHYIQCDQFSEQNRLIAATQLKNKIKQIYGVTEFLCLTLSGPLLRAL